MRKYLTLGVAILAILFSVAFVNAGTTTSSPLRQFNVTEDALYVNWTNNYKVNITLGVNTSVTNGLNLSIGNVSATVKANYSQTVSTSLCGDNPASGVRVLVQNATSLDYTNRSNISAANIANATLIFNSDCPAGRYFGYINITNETSGNDSLRINVSLHIPISANNSLTNTTGIGTFFGSMPANSTYYHSYFFNSSSIGNATSIQVNFSWSNSSTADPDIFLVNESGTLLAKSINKGGSETLFYNYLDPSTMYEIRIYGNSSSAISYSSGGYIIYSTLNVTNASALNQQVKEIDFGTFNVTNSSNYTNLTIINQGILNYSSISETKELFKFNEYGGTGSKNFTFVVPGSEIATNIRSEINWTGGSNYTIKLYNPSGTLVDSSNTKRVNSNFTGVSMEDYVESSSISTGLWRVEVLNNSASAEPYNVTVKIFVNASKYLSTNYSATSFNATGLGLNGSNLTYHVNLTILNSSLEGLLKGSLKYSNSNGEMFRVAVKFNVSAPVLVVNNSLNTGTTIYTDNIGFNRTLTSILNLSVNNTGTKNLSIIGNSSVTRLNLTSDSSKYVDINFTYPTTNITPASSGNLTINITINTSLTGNTEGMYQGWIFLNTTDTVPYQGFNLTIKVNLTSSITVSVNDILYNSFLTNSSASYNVTTKSKVFYINDSTSSSSNEITNLNISNFTAAYIISDNVTSYRYPTSGSLTYGNYTAPLWSVSDDHRVNVTVPSGLPGGNYSIYLSVSHSINGVTLSGTGSINKLSINNTGLNLTKNSSTLTLAAAATGYYNVSITNYGTVDSSGTLTPSSDNTNVFTVEADAVYSSTTPSTPGNCGSVASGRGSFNSVPISASGAEKCIYQVKVIAKNVSSTSTATLTFTPTDTHFGVHTSTVTVNGASSGSGGTTTGGGDSSGDTTNSTPTPSKQYKMKLSMPDAIEIVQGASKVVNVDVNNTGDAELLNVKLSISGIDSSWYSITPSSYSLIGVNFVKTYSITFNIPSSAEVKEYAVTVTGSADNGTGVSTPKLKVLPSATTIGSTNDTIANISSVIKALEKEIADLGNVTLETQLNTIKQKLTEAQNLANSGDYFNAIQKMREINSDIENLKNGIKSAQDADGTGLNVGYIVLGVITLLFVGVLAYLLIPPKEGYHPEKGFRLATQSEKQRHEMTKGVVSGLIDKIKSFFKKKE